MPRKSQLLPYLQATKGRSISYVRRVPPELQEFMGNQRWIRRSLGVTTTDSTDPALLRAWSSINEEIEQQFTAARAAKDASDSAIEKVQALSPRDLAAIAAEPFNQLREVMESGRISTDLQQQLAESAKTLVAQYIWAQKTGDTRFIREALAGLVEPVLQSLGISVDETDMNKIIQQSMRYGTDARADLEKLQAGDFSQPSLRTKAPPLPVKQQTWEQLLDQYLISAGGITEIDGIGVSQDRIAAYRLSIREICESSKKYFPNELTQDDVRKFVNSLQQGTLAIKTQRKRLDALRHLFDVGLRNGLVDANVFLGFKITKPRGVEAATYRSFTKDELVTISSAIQAMPKIDRRWAFDALLCTGARSGEILKLRTTDIQQSETGVWYFAFKHEPTSKYPTSLKGAQDSERKTPLHPLLIERGYLKYIKRKPEGYIINHSVDTSAWTGWFKKSVLVPTDIYCKGSTGLHSLRNSAIDIWREAGVPAEIRRALVAHAAADVQDKIYGEGLRNMPDVLFKEIKKVDLNWLP